MCFRVQQDAADAEGAEPEVCDCFVRLLIVGDSAVGKSDLMKRYTAPEEPWEPSWIATIGVDMKQKKLRLDSKWVKLQIWDTAGTERFQQTVTSYYKEAMGILLVYDVTDKESFKNIRREWVGRVKQHAPDNVNMVLVGNKSDMAEERQVPYARSKALADELGIPFFETNVKDNLGVEEAFTSLATAVLQRLPALTPVLAPAPQAAEQRPHPKGSWRLPGFLRRRRAPE